MPVRGSRLLKHPHAISWWRKPRGLRAALMGGAWSPGGGRGSASHTACGDAPCADQEKVFLLWQAGARLERLLGKGAEEGCR